MSGYELLAETHARWPDLPLLMITAYATPKLAVEAIKSGARSITWRSRLRREELLQRLRVARSGTDC